MSITRADFSHVDANDIQSLIDAGTPEGRAIEYKSQTYGGKDEDVKEFLKDISSFANSGGGHLLIGVEEKGGVPTAILPLAGDIDREIARLDSMARDGLEPRIQAQFRSIPVASGSVIVIRVAPSWAPPHRVASRKTNRIYVRGSSGAYEASMDELRGLFTAADTARTKAKLFRSSRLAEIEALNTPIDLATEPSRIVVHIATLSAFSAAPHTLDLNAAIQHDGKLRPMRADSFTPTINFDGFLVHRGGSDCHGYTQLYRDGRLEAVKVRAVASDGSGRIPSRAVEEAVMTSIPGYLAALGALGFSAPFMIGVTLQNVRGARLSTTSDWEDDVSPIRVDDLELPAIYLETIGSETEIQAAIRPAFDALWNSAGRTHCPNFNPDGTWKSRL